jgi:hypothetical protein
VIANDGTGTQEIGHYDCAVAHAGPYAGKPGAWRGGRVIGHLRKLSPYHLVREALAACLEGRRSKRADGLIQQVRDAESAKPMIAFDSAEEMRKFTEGFAYRPQEQGL